MPTDKPAAAALFIFAHQDDEYGVYQAILDAVSAGYDVHCAYLTDGSYGGCSPLRRNQESLRVLADLGVMAGNVAFAGCELGIADGKLPERLELCMTWLQSWLRSFPAIQSIHVPAWEGGHQDHDGLHAAVVGITADMAMLAQVAQFPLYNAHRCPGPLFRVFAPLAGNGPVTLRKLTFRNRLRFLRYCLSYHSQRRTWLGLFPFVLLHYLISGTQQLQPVSQTALATRPHADALFYEKRGYFSWNQMQKCISTAVRRETKGE